MALRFLALASLFFLFSAQAAPAPVADWPQFRGVHRDGLSVARGLARQWPAEGPKVVWKRPIGAGFSSISAVDGRLYTMAADGDKEYAYCLEAATGAEVWRAEVGERFVEEFGDGPRSTPTLDGEVAFVLSSKGNLHALKRADGSKIWSVDIPKTFGSEVPRWGFSGSPLIDGDLLVLDVGGTEGRAMAGFDKATGATRWTVGDGPAGYSSPIPVEIDGVRQYIFARRMAAGAELISVSPKGEILWHHPAPPSVITSALFVPPNRIYISSGDDAGALLVEVKMAQGEGKVTPEIKEVWKTNRFKNHFNSSLLLGDRFFGFDNATFKSVSLEKGEQIWAFRGLGKGSLVSADDLLFVLTDEGTLVLVEATGESYQEKGRLQVMTGRAWTSPSLAGDKLYVRDQDEMVAIDLSAPPAATP